MGSYDGGDVLGLLAFLAVLLIILAALVGIVIAMNTRRRRRGKGSDTLVVDWTLTVSAFAVLAFLIGVPIAVIQTMTARQVSLDDFPFRTTLLDGRFPCDGSTATARPQLECLDVDTGTATLSGLSTGIRALIAIDQVLWALLAVLPAVALGVICFQMLRGIPFARLVSGTLVASAVAVVVLGIAAAVFDGLSRGVASAAVLPPDGPDAVLASPGFSMTLPLWPFGAGLALIALAAVFRYGAKLQRDTEGLV